MNRPSSPDLAGLLACPACHGDLRAVDGHLACSSCGGAYPIVDGIPVFVATDSADHDELDHHGEGHDRHKVAQAAFFDRDALAEFEIERPGGRPSLYRFLMHEKFRRGIEPLGRRLDGWTALTVCGGSGMDAEFLAAAGAATISSDLSLGAARRAAERARRHGVPILSIVADVERLPFRDRSVDLVYVHDGLHHLADPNLGLAEMTRVAGRAVSITEPARAAVTAVAVRLGVAQDREDSGNIVARLDPESVGASLRRSGFRVLRVSRYAMFYRHHPGRFFALFDRPLPLAIARFAWRSANLVLGRIGNKLAVVAERPAP